MTSTNGNNTLDRIQKEIKETLQREDELRNKSETIPSSEKTSMSHGETVNNNNNHHTIEPTPVKKNGLANISAAALQNHKASNGFRRFTPNSTTKGVMQKFLKMRGKLSTTSILSKPQPQQNNNWTFDDVFMPAKVTIEKGKLTRNGFVPAEEKMKKELQEFQIREAELRKERRKSQPDLMASLQTDFDSNGASGDYEETSSSLKSAKSMANIYGTSDDFNNEFVDNHSAPCSLKPARSLAALCDLSDEEIETPGTLSLIMQFEQLKNQQVRS